MLINLYSKKFFKLFTPIFLCLTFFDITIFNKELKAEKKLQAATETDLFLYRQMGASYPVSYTHLTLPTTPYV